MERGVLPSIIIVFLCYNVHILETSFTSITGNPGVVNVGENLTMSCKYNGSFTVNSIFWERNSAGVQIRLLAGCIPASIPDSTVYNMNRTTCNCDQVNNIYNLTLNNIVAKDDGNSWSCSLRLSAGNSTEPVVYMIRLQYTTTARNTATPIIKTPTNKTSSAGQIMLLLPILLLLLL